MDDSASSILGEYDGKVANFTLMLDSCRRLVADLLKVASIDVHSITGRVKERSSLQEKLSRAGKDYSALSEITDVVGLRVVTFFEDDVDRVAALISDEFSKVEKHCIDKRNTLEPDRFGYRSLHYVCNLSPSRRQLTENTVFRDEQFEIQIRSILQHAWAEIEHDLGYKGEISVPAAIKRKLSRIAGLLEIADRDFREVREESRDYRNMVLREIARNEVRTIRLDMDSYLAFINSSPLVQELDSFLRNVCGFKVVNDDSPESTIASLRHVGIDTIEDLQRELQLYKELLESYAYEVFGPPTPNERTIASGISVFHLPQLLALDKNGVSGLTNLYETVGLAPPDLRESFAQTTNERLQRLRARARKRGKSQTSSESKRPSKKARIKVRQPQA